MGLLDEKVALVTGAARGQGEGIAMRFAAEGAVVVCADVLDASSVADSLPPTPSGRRSRAVAMDVTDVQAVEEIVSEVVDEYGTIDILYNNAGIAQPPMDVIDTPDEIYYRVTAVDLFGVIACSRAAGRVMRERRSGRIINTSSQIGKVAFKGYGVYAAAKAGVISITQAMALELAPYSVTVNCVCPGAMATDMMRDSFTEEEIEDYARSVPLGRLGTPKDIAALAAWIASDEASFLTSATINFTGGEQAFF